MNARQRFANACRGLPVDRPPVWLMRQAGRSLPEYRALREHHEFWELLTTPELAAEVTRQPLRRFEVDAAIIFSDILVIPAALGQKVLFGGGMTLTPPIRGANGIAALKTSGTNGRLEYVAEALKIVREELADEQALLGFAGAPFTVASYMVEGGGSKSYSRLKAMMYREPATYERLLSVVTDATIEYLQLQIECGVDAVQLFDSWAGELSPDDYRKYAQPFVKRIIEQLAPTETPVVYFINGIGNLLEEAKACGPAVLGIDWRVSLEEVRRRLGANTIVQGNLDPGVLYAEPAEIRRRTLAMIDETGGRGHIANLGHGVAPDTPLDGIYAFVEAVQEWNSGGNEKV
jgi:uroporphyrinogen decarboxylase